MKSRAPYTRIFLCALLLLSSLLVLSLQEIPAKKDGGDNQGTSTTSSAATSSAKYSTSLVSVTATVTATINRTVPTTVKVTNTTRITLWSTENITSTLTEIPLVPGYVSIPSEIIPAMVLGFVIIVVALFGSAMILRSRSLRDLDELNELRTNVRMVAPEEVDLSASSSLKRLLELGILQPKEYMEKKIMAERMEKKMSAKQLLDKGLISREQYDILAGKQE
jgi:hypothetical protein